MNKHIALEFKNGPVCGEISVSNGRLFSGSIVNGEGTFTNGCFSVSSSGSCRIKINLDSVNISLGKEPTMVHVRIPKTPFTFFLRDVSTENPIFIPGYGVAVIPALDKRSYANIQKDIRKKGLQSIYQRIDQEPEESYENAAANTRKLESPIWLGISRDVRIFEVGMRHPMHVTDYIQPRFAGNGYFGPTEEGCECGRFGFVAGRGWGCSEEVSRWIEDNRLPIFHAERYDGNITYEQIFFVTLETSSLTANNIRGTHSLVADGLSSSSALNEEQREKYKGLLSNELKRSEETVLCCRIIARNNGQVPCYAFFKAIHPVFGSYGSPDKNTLDGKTGFGYLKDSGDVFAVSRLNSKPMPQQEIAILIKPGEHSIYEFFLPHQPIPESRAVTLAKRSMANCLKNCRDFWNAKLNVAAKIILPEKRIEEMIYAGILHTDIVSYGLEPNGSLDAANGAYSAVASETVRNIYFLDSMRLNRIAERCIEFFFTKQHKSGFIQTFEGYMLETGPVLWIIGEHYRLTHNEEWLEKIKDKIFKACKFIIKWRRENLRKELRGNGYGMMPGKVADPKDDERIFMLNGYMYLGLSRMAEIFEQSDPDQAKLFRQEADELKKDIRFAFFESLAKGPLIPLADGSWCPTSAPWVAPHGPKCLFSDDGDLCWSHGAMTVRDDILGPMHLVFQEVLAPEEQATTFLLNYHNELFYMNNVAFSEPYYSPHPNIHLKRGEVKAFLKSYYNTFASIADRETYSFWEHYFHVSPHKIGDEGQFLMQTRMMLYMEEGNTLLLLRGVPRAWLEDGKEIQLENIISYFGTISLQVVSKVKNKVIEASIQCDSDWAPENIEIRLPHPENRKAVSVEGGRYVAEKETVVVEDFHSIAKIKLNF